VFETMFFGEMATISSSLQNPIIVNAFIDFPAAVFKLLIESVHNLSLTLNQCHTNPLFILGRYIYTEQVPLKQVHETYDLFYAAQKYMIPSLVEKCSYFISKELNDKGQCLSLS